MKVKIIVTETLKIWLVKGKVTIAKCLKSGRFVSHKLANAVLEVVEVVRTEKSQNKKVWLLQDLKREIKGIENTYWDKSEFFEFSNLKMSVNFERLAKKYKQIYHYLSNECLNYLKV